MDVPPVDPPPRAPLSPFAFPSDTDFRFVLLLVAVIGSTLFIYNDLAFHAPGEVAALLASGNCLKTGPSAALTTNALRDMVTRPLQPSMTDQQQQFVQASAASSECQVPFNERHAALTAGGVGGMLALAGLIYWFMPAWKIRRGRLRALRPQDAPDVVTLLGELCREAGLTGQPEFLWDPMGMNASGLAFGRLGRKYVVLSAALILQAARDRAAFRAMVLHELGHLRNADVDKTYFTISLCLAFIVAALVPFAVGLVNQSLDWILGTMLRIAALAVFVYLAAAAVLRAREVYADARAALWEVQGGALSRILAKAHGVPPGWRRLFSMHPDAGARVQLLANPRPLFRPGIWEAFAAGLAIGISTPSLLSFASELTARAQNPMVAGMAVGLIFGPIVVGIVGLGVWRSTFAALSLGERPAGAGRLALAVGGGSLIGRVLSFDSLLGQNQPPVTYAATVLGLGFIWGALLALLVWLLLRWIGVGASAWWQRAAEGSTSMLRRIYAIGLVAAAGMLALCLGVIVPLSSMSSLVAVQNELGAVLVTLVVLAAALPVLLVAMATQLPQPAVSLALFSLWAFPLSSALSSSRSTASRQLHTAALTAVVVGLVGGVLVLLRWNAWRAEVPRGTGTDEEILAFAVTNFVLAWVMQLVGSAIVAIRTGSFLQGLGAGFVVGCIMSASILGVNLWHGGGAEASFVQTVFALVVNGGSLLALVTALVASRLGRRTRREASMYPIRLSA